MLGDDLVGGIGVEWEGDARGRGYMSTYSRFTYCTAETNSVKLLKKKKNQHLEIKDHHKPELDMLNIGQKKKTVHRETMCIRIMITFKIIKIFFKYKILCYHFVIESIVLDLTK